MNTSPILHGALALAFLSVSSRAQSFNIDGGFGTPVPSASYGAAAGQPGTWNAYVFPSPNALLDLQGQPTSVLCAITTSHPAGDFVNWPGVTGDAAALLNDWIGADNQFGADVARIDVVFSNLANGAYEVFTYAYTGAPVCDSAVMVVGSSDPTAITTGPANNALAPGATHVRHRVQVTAGTLSLQVFGISICEPFNRIAVLNGLQLVKLDGGSHSVCAGDGAASACPCGNFGGVGRGCANSFDATGAGLVGSGVASASADTFVLSATGVSNSFVTYFQGTQPLNAGNGLPFGDGLLCAGGTLTRLVMRLASNESVSYPLVGETALSTLGGVDPVGGSRVYQIFYRDAFTFCTSATFNTTNAVETAWVP